MAFGTGLAMVGAEHRVRPVGIAPKKLSAAIQANGSPRRRMIIDQVNGALQLESLFGG